MFGLQDSADLIGRSILDRIHPEERSAVAERSRRVSAGIPADRAERRCLRKDGETVFVEASIVPIEYEGRPSSLVFMRDISERKKNEAERTALEEQLRQAQKMESIGRLAGGIAHDFNNYIMIINWHGEMLASHLAPDDSAKEMLARLWLPTTRRRA
jgi:PAS domain S-box-containing protein